jgi:hypothetical protein
MIAFGSVFIPTNETMEIVLTYVSENSDYGFIISAKPQFYKDKVFELVNNNPHVFIG